MLSSEGIINDVEEAVRAMRRPDVLAESDLILSAPCPPPNAVILSEKPLIYYVDDVVSPEECEYIIQAALPQMKRARVSGTAGCEEGARESKARTNSVAWMLSQGDQTFERVEDRMCDLVGCRPECTESFQVIHYDEGQEYQVTHCCS